MKTETIDNFKRKAVALGTGLALLVTTGCAFTKDYTFNGLPLGNPQKQHADAGNPGSGALVQEERNWFSRYWPYVAAAVAFGAVAALIVVNAREDNESPKTGGSGGGSN